MCLSPIGSSEKTDGATGRQGDGLQSRPLALSPPSPRRFSSRNQHYLSKRSRLQNRFVSASRFG